MTKKSKTPLPSKVTFVGGKWYNERGEEVPKPQPKVAPQSPEQLQRYERGHVPRPDGCTCAKPENTGHVPGCKWFETALYACEKGNRATVESLAHLASTTVADLEQRRLGYAVLPECWDLVPTDTHRRRCWRCPYWERHQGETPFDRQKRNEQLDEFPKALLEEDDDLPF